MIHFCDLPSGIKTCLHIIIGGGLTLISLHSAFADECDKLNSNTAWNDNFQQLNDAFKQQNWDKAIAISRDLEAICDQSPKLNYVVAHIYQKKGDNEKYLYYLTKSTQNTERFGVDRDMLERMWSEKYIAAHPEADPQNIKTVHEKLEATTAELERLKQSSASELGSLKQSTITKDESLPRQIDDYATPMWIGAGIGIGGLVLVGVGAALIATTEPIKFNSAPQVPSKYKESPTHAIGWTALGVGSALTLTGAVLAGIYGFKYKLAQNTMNLSFNISSTSASIAFEF